ncbi:hypothetical protein NUSPORA_00447 [Nucleospora cyclopteri]
MHGNRIKENISNNKKVYICLFIGIFILLITICFYFFMNLNKSDSSKPKPSNNDDTRNNPKPDKPSNPNPNLPVKPEFRYYGGYHFGENPDQRHDSSSSHNDRRHIGSPQMSGIDTIETPSQAPSQASPQTSLQAPPQTPLQTLQQTQTRPFNYSDSNNSSDTTVTRHDSEEITAPQLPEIFQELISRGLEKRSQDINGGSIQSEKSPLEQFVYYVIDNQVSININENSNLIETYTFQQIYDSYLEMRRGLDFYIEQNNIDINTNIGLKRVINFFFNNMLNGYFLRLSNIMVTFIRTNLDTIDINSLPQVVQEDFHLVNETFYILIKPIFDLLSADTTNIQLNISELIYESLDFLYNYNNLNTEDIRRWAFFIRKGTTAFS